MSVLKLDDTVKQRIQKHPRLVCLAIFYYFYELFVFNGRIGLKILANCLLFQMSRGKSGKKIHIIIANP